MVKNIFIWLATLLIAVGFIYLVGKVAEIDNRRNEQFYVSQYSLYSSCVDQPMPYKMFKSLSREGVAKLFTNTVCVRR